MGASIKAIKRKLLRILIKIHLTAINCLMKSLLFYISIALYSNVDAAPIEVIDTIQYPEEKHFANVKQAHIWWR
jgi:hypothetical protein